MNHWRPLLVLALGALLVPSAAHAADPSKLECIAANDAAQDLRREGKLRDAREKLALCVSVSCPGPVREDCAQRLTDLDAVMPTIVFDVKDAGGRDVPAVTISVDGRRVPDLSGLPLPVDPGEHRFTFEAEGLRRADKAIVMHEGERNRLEHIVLDLGRAPIRTDSAAPSAPAGNSQRIIALAVGGVGVVGLVIGSVLGLVSKSNYDHALQAECGNNPNGGCSPEGIADGKSAHGQAAASTVAFVAGGALLAGGAVLYFTAPRTSVSVGTAVGSGRAGIVVVGAW